MYAPEARRAVIMMQTEFGTHSVYIAVLTHRRGVIRRLAGRQHTAIAEGVLAIRIHVLGIKGQREALRQLDIDAHIGVRKRERAKTHLPVYVHLLVLFKIRFTGREIHVSRSAKLPCRLEDIGFLAVKELYLLEVIQRETSQIHLPVLSVAKLHAVIVHRRVLASHGADIDGLDTSHSAVVLELYTGEIAQGICDRERVQTLEFVPL